MPFSHLPLAYCANVHPGSTFDAVCQNLRQYAGPVRDRLGMETGVGLWLNRPVMEEVTSSPRHAAELAALLDQLGLTCYTLNAFPFGDFHARRVKTSVYQPDWRSDERLRYTCQAAQLLAQLLAADRTGSISTLPLGFKGSAGPLEEYIPRILATADFLRQLRDQQGKWIRLAIEPEPFCVLETIPEFLAFFDRLRHAAAAAGTLDAVDDHLGICLDVCHQAVEFENIEQSIQSLVDHEIPIVKVHVTCALELRDPHPQAREELSRFAEERYLHQVFVRLPSGEIDRREDLTAELATDPPESWRQGAVWRIHFHVPVHRETMGLLHTTRGELVRALAAVKRLPEPPHLEVETYTWSVLPPSGSEQESGLVDGLCAELRSTRELLDRLAGEDAR